jgi:hypothetical protein
MSAFTVLPPGPLFDAVAKRGFVFIICDQCWHVLLFDEVLDRSTMAQNDQQFFLLRENPDAACFFSTESADAGAKSAGWATDGGKVLCKRCRRAV